MTSSNLASKPLLPIKVSIREIWPTAATPLDQVTVLVVLRNGGKEAIMLLLGAPNIGGPGFTDSAT